MTDVLWPWFAVAGAGALHGLNPAAGWAVIAWRWRHAAGAQAWSALAAVAAGHAASIVLVAAAVPAALRFGLEFDPLVLQGVAAALLLVAVLRHFTHRTHGQARAGGGIALALWSFIVGTAHGAGWLLVPALVPLCASGMPGREIAASGSLGLALGAVGLHLAAMLVASALMAAGAQRAFAAAWRAVIERDRC